MNHNQHVKSFNPDPRAKNRIKFASVKQRAKQASADVYRTYKRRTGIVTSAASREERVHHIDQFNDSRNHKRRKTITAAGEATVVVSSSTEHDLDIQSEDEGLELELETGTTFQMELDLSRDRNASTLFEKLYNEILPLVGSLPEILHHSEKIIRILLSYVLSPYTTPNEASPENMWKNNNASNNKTTARELYMVNIVTTDVLHLMSVLARDLRHEIHPFLHSMILPRLVNDLINPPTKISDPDMKQQFTLDITVIEAAFRTISYIFRYDTNVTLLEEDSTHQSDDKKTEGCLELMRQYYGSTLAHKSEMVRRLGAESFAPLVRKLKSNSSKKKHIRRVIRSLATSAASSVTFSTETPDDSAQGDCYEPDVVMNSGVKRTIDDAVDGVATLLFYVVKGVPGKLHSKGESMIKMIFSNLIPSASDTSDSTNVRKRNVESYKWKVTFYFMSLLLSKIRSHVKNGPSFSIVWNELLDNLEKVVTALEQNKSSFAYSLGYIVQLMEECVSHKDGELFKGREEASLDFENSQCDRLSLELQDLIQSCLYSKLGSQNQKHVLKLICSSWKLFQEHHIFGKRLCRCIPILGEIRSSTVDPMSILVKDLLPFLSEDSAADYVVPAVMNSLAKTYSEGDIDRTVYILHDIATSSMKRKTDIDRSVDDQDDISSMDFAAKCKLPVSDKEVLINTCLTLLKITASSEINKDMFRRLGYAVTALPFLVFTGSVEKEGSDASEIERVAVDILMGYQALDAMEINSYEYPDLLVVKSLMIQGFAFTLSKVPGKHEMSPGMRKMMKNACKESNNFLLKFPKSILATKSAAALGIAVEKFGISFSRNSDELFDALNLNLRSSSHFFRLHTLRLLSTFPERPYVTNIDEVDLSEDLDESEFKSSKPEVLPRSSSLKGTCGILKTLLQIESTPLGINTERTLIGAINRVEILGRSGKLPVVYAEAAVNHMFGVMHIKFQPLWGPAVRAIIALTRAHEQIVWPSISAQLHLVMDPSFFACETMSSLDLKTDCTENEASRYHENLLKWEMSGGEIVDIFQEQINFVKVIGRISRHQSTDHVTYFEQVWSVMEKMPELTTKKSRFIVPLFLNFLHHQYFLFHDDDPDARELKLEAQTESTLKSNKWCRENLNRKMIQKQTVSFIKMFAEVKGMQQLYKHKLLRVIFLSFLSNSDTLIAQLSLRCIAQFKLPFVLPYLDYLKGILAKDNLREVLTKFKLSRDHGDIDIEHRNNLCHLILRLLFGRLSAHGAGSKSSKDSPAVRRAAIISFLGGLDAANGELDYFVYMMVRPFISKSVDMDITGISCENWNIHFPKMIQQVLFLTSVEEISKVPTQRLEGFLNLLQEVVKKLGFGVVKFVPVFVKIILCILEHMESLRRMPNKDQERPLKEDIDEVKEETKQESGPNRGGKIRSLCFLRLSDIMSQFADDIDIPWPADDMWRIIKPALEILPSSTISASNPPSLLVLLETISSHPNLITLLARDECSVIAVFTCLSLASKVKVADSILKFIDNLLTEGGLYDYSEDIRKVGTDTRIGIALLKNHVDLLVSQFTARLKSTQEDDTKKTFAVSKELSILCRVTLLVSTEERDFKTSTDTMATLCNLLIPFLDFGKKCNERTRLDVLGILRSVLPDIGHDSAISHLQTFARLLGPNKSNSGIRLIEVRQGIIGCISAIAQNPSEDSLSLQNVVNVLQNLNASNPKHVDEWDFDLLLPVLNGLGKSSISHYSWQSLSKFLDKSKSGLQILMPIVYSCFHLLHDPDGILSRGAAKALAELVSFAAAERATNSSWQRLVETSMMACIRMGIKTHNISVRKSFISLLSRVAIDFADVKSPGFCSDLCLLIREDEPDLDFFLNITHVQIHRRSRALGRLRKLLAGFSYPDDCLISTHSLTNYLLPLTLHPIYECEKKEEESYAMEAIATIGVIAKLLPWGKYQNVLWTALMQVPRHESQERYIFAMISNIIDSFHFTVDVPHHDAEEGSNFDGMDDEKDKGGHYIWKQLDKKLIPSVERYLMKETVDRDGTKNESLRSPVALALTKLFMKLPSHIFELKFPRLLIAICQALKNRDSDERDIARKTLAQVAITVDVKYLSDILRELALGLTEGYKLHVRIAALHSILFSLSKSYELPDIEVSCVPSFDCCVPAMMDMIQQDLFGTASDMKEIESTKKRLVKEAGGAKSLDSLEIISRMILFNPSTVDQTQHLSSIHILVEPFLARLDDPEVSSAVIGKVKEALSRIVMGVSQNPSVSPDEMFPFVYSTLSPYIAHERTLPEASEDFEESDDEHIKDLEVSRTNSLPKNTKSSNESKRSIVKVFNWAPSQLKIAKDNQDAYQIKMKEKLEQRKVHDGANAPKLTGSSRYDSLRSKRKDLNSPAISCAVAFGLGLLHSHLKKKHSECSISMTDPFVKILYTFVKDSKDDNAVLLSLKCLQVLLRLDLPSVRTYSGLLADCILKIISKLSCNTQNEMVQSCFKILTLLLSSDKNSALELHGGKMASAPKSTSYTAFADGAVFSKNQMQVLISILQSALTDAEHHNSTFGVIKAVTSRQYISPEFYDLMDKILQMTVQSQKPTMRQQASRIFMQYLIEYPMGKKRLETHLKQVVLNIKYEYEDGRISALELLNAVINKLPLPLLEEYTQLLFLPLILQLVNDDSKTCRERAGECITILLSRLSTQVLQSLYEYAERWSGNSSDRKLQRTSVQLFGLFVEARSDFMKKNGRIETLLSFISNALNNEIGDVDQTDVLVAEQHWEIVYYCLQTIEKIGNNSQSILWKYVDLWVLIIKCLAHSHPWVQLIASRSIHSHFASCKVEHFDTIHNKAAAVLLRIPGSIFEIARNLCFELNSEDHRQSDDIIEMAVKNLSWIIKIMDKHPKLCYKGEDVLDVSSDLKFDGDEDGNPNDQVRNPVTWLMTRLSNIAKKPGSVRREAIFKCFAAFATFCDAEIIGNHLELMVEPLQRVIIETEAREESLAFTRNFANNVNSSETSTDLPHEVLNLLEEKCGTESFIQTLSKIKCKAREKRKERKHRIAVEVMQDPEAAAKRKIAKHQKEKNRKKRRIEDRKIGRGVFTKKPRHVVN